MRLAEVVPLELDSEAGQVYRRALDILAESGVPFLVGGAYSLAHHAGIIRHTKDFDVFVLPGDCERVLARLAEERLRRERARPALRIE
jgi:hypothetical protein